MKTKLKQTAKEKAYVIDYIKHLENFMARKPQQAIKEHTAAKLEKVKALCLKGDHSFYPASGLDMSSLFFGSGPVKMYSYDLCEYCRLKRNIKGA